MTALSCSSSYHAANICVISKFYQEWFFKFTSRELRGVVTIIGWYQSLWNPTRNNHVQVWDVIFPNHNGLESTSSFFWDKSTSTCLFLNTEQVCLLNIVAIFFCRFELSVMLRLSPINIAMSPIFLLQFHQWQCCGFFLTPWPYPLDVGC